MRVPDPQSVGWLDGRRVPLREISIPVADPTFHAGLGLFETLAVRGAVPWDLDLHLDRLERGAARLGAAVPARRALADWARQAAAEAPAGYAWLKIVITGGGRCAIFSGAMDPGEEGRAVAAVLLPWRRNPHDPLSGLKSLNYAASTIGLEHARRRGADEGLWLNTRGHLAEGCTSNLFIVSGRRLFTPAERDGILPGIVRGLVLRAARERSMIVHEGKIRLERLRRAREAFLTSSLCGVRPLTRFEGRSVGDGSRGPATERLAEAVAGLRRPPGDANVTRDDSRSAAAVRASRGEADDA